jgi:DNA replication ATP-dependent helicase/nuclease Dna2
VLAGSATYRPSCVLCGPDPHCDQPWVEGVVSKVERHVHLRPARSINGVRVHLDTAGGPCLLDLGERYGYLDAGLSEVPKGLVLRAYHLRKARAMTVKTSSRRSAAPHYLTGAGSLVVLEPDWLVDVTALSGTDYCLRQWLANRLAAQPAALYQLRGNVVHACFQALCRDGVPAADCAPTQVAGAGFGLALLGASTQELLEAVEPHLDRLAEWRARFADELFADPTATPCFESTLLCPELGLRGRIDLALRRATAGRPPLVTRVVELKTGKYNEQWPDPEFQVRGYYAILAVQQRLAPDFRAQVIYTGSATVSYRDVVCGPEHIEHLVNRRNQAVLALLVGHAPPSNVSNRCRMSSNRADCVQLSALLSLDHCRGRDLHDAACGAVDPEDAEFYATHYRLLRLESRATSHDLACLWRMGRAEREEAGTTIAIDEVLSQTFSADGRWHYRFSCRNSSELRAGETVLLSDGDPVRGEVVVGTLIEAGAETAEVTALEPVTRPMLIDRYYNGEAQDRTLRGLHAWMRAPKDLRALLYASRAPAFAVPNGSMQEPAYARDLNARQAAALDLALRARDYLLVQGPPGTGKTYLIARMVRALAARGERVIVSAWTNRAVDTVLQALRAQGFAQFARLGATRSMDPSLLPYALLPETTGAFPAALSPEALAVQLRTIPVLAGTVSSFADARISAATVRRDVVILDEAAQLSIAASVGVLRLAPRFVLVGDDQQLPAVVHSEEAAREGLSISPFAILRPEAQAHGALIRLVEQYRMHQAIAAWPSEAFYDGDLCAHPTVRHRRLPPPTGPCEDRIASREVPVVVVDAGPLAVSEAESAAHAAISLARSGVPPAEIGIVAPFRATVAAVRRLLDSTPETAGCTVDTVDRFQGGQREAMIVCLGLSGIGRRGHAFVDDPRRLNVAFTRARAKLVVVGDLAGAAALPTLAGFLQHCLDHGMPVVQDRQVYCALLRH